MERVAGGSRAAPRQRTTAPGAAEMFFPPLPGLFRFGLAFTHVSPSVAVGLFGWHGQVLLPVSAVERPHGQEYLPMPPGSFVSAGVLLPRGHGGFGLVAHLFV